MPPAISPESVRLAVDIGGTFTDVVLETPGGRYSAKVLTTKSAPEDGVLDGMLNDIQVKVTEGGPARWTDRIVRIGEGRMNVEKGPWLGIGMEPVSEALGTKLDGIELVSLGRAKTVKVTK